MTKPEWDAAILEHLDLVPGVRLPEIADPKGIAFFEEWRQRFDALQITPEQLRQALRDVRANPPREHARHMPAVLDRAISIRAGAETSRLLREYRSRPDEPAFDRAVLAQWNALSRSDRESWRSQARRQHPGLEPFPSLLEPVARALWWESAARRAELNVRDDDPAGQTFDEGEF